MARTATLELGPPGHTPIGREQQRQVHRNLGDEKRPFKVNLGRRATLKPSVAKLESAYLNSGAEPDGHLLQGKHNISGRAGGELRGRTRSRFGKVKQQGPLGVQKGKVIVGYHRLSESRG